MKKRVSVFVIGAMKAGTTALYRSLKEQAGIGVSQTKEPNFFLQDQSSNDIKRYHDLFPEEDILVDVSPNYSKAHLFPGVADRIRIYNPDSRIIYLLRDPFERTLSHLHHGLLRGRHTSRNPEKILRAHPQYIQTSRYYSQLKPYLDAFEKEKILLLTFEELKGQPERLLEKLATFLKVPLFQDTIHAANVSSERYKIPLHDKARTLLKAAGLFDYYKQFWRLVNIRVDKPSLSKEASAWLAEQLTEDVTALEEAIGFDTSHWNTYHAYTVKKVNSSE